MTTNEEASWLLDNHMDCKYPNLQPMCDNIPLIPTECFSLNPRVFANRYDGFKSLGNVGNYCEVGVAYGEFTEFVIKNNNPEEIHLIDLFEIQPEHRYLDKNYLEETGLNHLLYVYKKFRDDPRVHLHKGYSWEQLALFPDNFFDTIYIDASHNFINVMQDTEYAIKKIKNGGTIIFNDYTFISPGEYMAYGVFKLVNELLNYYPKYKVLYYALGNCKMDDIAVQINK